MQVEIFNFYLARARLGDQDAKRELLLALDPLIKSSIKKYCPIYREYEDLYQDGRLIILECLDLYDESRGNFLNYIKNYLRYYYLDTFKYLLKEDENLTRQKEDLNIFDFIEDDFDLELAFLKQASHAELRKRIATLSKRQRQVISMFYFLEMSLKEIADALGIKSWTVVNTKRRAMEILREARDDY